MGVWRNGRVSAGRLMSDYISGSSVTAFPVSSLTNTQVHEGVLVIYWTEAAYSSSLTKEHHRHPANRTVAQISLVPAYEIFLISGHLTLLEHS